MFDFGKNESGNVAMVFALAMLPTMGIAGAAFDYSRASAAREFLRKTSDQVAVAIVAAEGRGAAAIIAGAKAQIEEQLGSNVSKVSVTGEWLDSRNYQVRIEADLEMRIVQAVPAMPKSMPVIVETVTMGIPPSYETRPPHRSLLEPEASDYNRVYMYCYNHDRRDEPDRGRRAVTPIADNATKPTDFSKTPGWKLPTCGAGEVVSYRLRNVRGARSDPKKWDDPRQEVYDYWADATLDPDTRVLRHVVDGYRVYSDRRERIDMVASPILETIRCRTDAECRTVAEGGIIPNRRTNRDPATATAPCEEGMFMYFGWEDRPPGQGWTDRDYDDIRLVISCPVRDRTTEKAVMIVR